MPSVDASSPTRRHSVIIGKSISRRKKQGDSNSVGSDASEGVLSATTTHRSSSTMDGKSSRGDNDSGKEHSKLGKLMSKGIGARRRRKKLEREDEIRTSEEVARGRSIAERGTLHDNAGDDHSSIIGDGSSQITYESDEEANPSPPSLTSHPSHIGYITTTSPLIQATKNTEEDTIGQAQDAATASRAPVPLVVVSPTSSSNSALNLQTPIAESPQRSVSPVGRLKEALSPTRGNSPQAESDKKTVLMSTKESGASRRGSISTRLPALFQDKQLTGNTQSPKSPSQNNKDPKISPSSVSDDPPTIVNTPPTPTDAANSRHSVNIVREGSKSTISSNPNVITSPSGNMISHRRVKSGPVTNLGPSKLSNITSAPLTPTPENSVASNSQTGFFSSVLSAAQNAANTLSNTITSSNLTAGQSKNRPAVQEVKEKDDVVDDVEVESADDDKTISEAKEKKELAVKTLGQGELSLSHLGISDSSSIGATPSTAKSSEAEQHGQSDIGRQDAGAPSDMVESFSTVHADDVHSVIRPRSMYEPSVPGDHTPPNGSVFEGKSGVGRNASIRSTISPRRKRGSSAATGTGGAIAAAIAAANSSVARPAAQDAAPKLTGFAVASKKRNRDFHQLFRSVPDDDYLIEDYSCAIQREILAHGRLYVSEGHLCFSSNIFGWVTTLVMSFDEIVSVEKRSTALLFKNGLMISTLHAKNIFASFTSRDSTYDLIVGIWKLGHPSLRSSLNGVRLEGPGGGDKTEKDDGHSQLGSGSEDGSGEGDGVYDEDDEDDDGSSMSEEVRSITASDVGLDINAGNRKISVAVSNAAGPTAEKARGGSPTTAADDFPGPASHGPTECSDQDSHYDVVIANEIIPAPLGKVYNLMFGPQSVTWMSKWLTVEQKCTDLQMEDKKGLTNENKTRTYSYIKPLNGSIGPRQTKCIVTETIEALDLEKAVSITMSTQTPDVPSGNVFTTKTKYCLTWAEGNSTRMQMNCTIDWTGKSWLKVPIEKGAKDGQGQYVKDILASLKTAVATKGRVAVGGVPGAKKKKGRKGGQPKSANGQNAEAAGDRNKATEAANWGLLEPLRGVLGPVVDILKPLGSSNMVYGLLVGLLVAAWFSFGYGRNGHRKDMSFLSSPERIAAYEEIWRREESELWEWLEERVGMDQAHRLHTVGRVEEMKNMQEKVRGQKAQDKEIEEAIQATAAKLKALQGVLERKKGIIEVAADAEVPAAVKE